MIKKNVISTKYLLLSYSQESISDVFEFEHNSDDLDVGSPYDNDRPSGTTCGFSVGSNQRIIKKEDATQKILDLLEE